MAKILKKIEDLKIISDEAKKSNKNIVLTGGVFDIFHFDHIKFLKYCKQQGDILVVHLVSDQKVTKLKGENRPILKLDERLELLRHLDFIDYIEVIESIDSNLDSNLIYALKPEIIVRTYKNENDKLKIEDLIESFNQSLEVNIKIIWHQQQDAISSSKIIQRIVSGFEESKNINQLSKPDIELVELAKKTSLNFYNYSEFRVGSAVRSDRNNLYSGCNISNSNSNLGICAERVAINEMVSKGDRSIDTIVIYFSKSDSLGNPCGYCRQIISEFADKNTKIILTNDTDDVVITNISVLLPNPLLTKKTIFKI